MSKQLNVKLAYITTKAALEAKCNTCESGQRYCDICNVPNALEWIKDHKNEECVYCNYETDKNVIFIDTLTDEWYYRHRTNQWDDVDDDWIYEKIYIEYCPWCGRKLN